MATASAITSFHALVAQGSLSAVTAALDLEPSLASAQDDATGISPLMRAAEIGSLPLCTLLISSGAPWNAVSRHNKCAGDFAFNNSHQAVADFLVDIGTKAELLLSAAGRLDMKSLPASVVASGESEEVEFQPCTKPDYLGQSVRYDGDTLMDADNDAVMMEWERPLMSAHADIISSDSKGKTVLNVGFGMGIVDGYLQGWEPEMHYIIEAHPGVHEKMLKDGWGERKNVTILFGRWQDRIKDVPTAVLDGAFYDTYGEHHTDLEDFQAALPRILKVGGVYSFFNGLCPDNIFFHGVACNVVKIQLERVGFEVEFAKCEIQIKEGAWEGVRRKYWHFDEYFLPICVFKGKKEEGGSKRQKTGESETK